MHYLLVYKEYSLGKQYCALTKEGVVGEQIDTTFLSRVLERWRTTNVSFGLAFAARVRILARTRVCGE